MRPQLSRTAPATVAGPTSAATPFAPGAVVARHPAFIALAIGFAAFMPPAAVMVSLAVVVAAAPIAGAGSAGLVAVAPPLMARAPSIVVTVVAALMAAVAALMAPVASLVPMKLDPLVFVDQTSSPAIVMVMMVGGLTGAQH